MTKATATLLLHESCCMAVIGAVEKSGRIYRTRGDAITDRCTTESGASLRAKSVLMHANPK
jgi:hypothetical protein